MTTWLTWREAMERALYGADGFYRRPGGGPAAHFRTSVHNPVFADAVVRLLVRVDDALGQPDRLDFVDVGSGRGELVEAVDARLRASDPGLAERLRACSVEVADRPAELPGWIGWERTIPAGINGLLIANEWLDNVVVDVAEVGADGVVRIVEVDADSGAERLGAELNAEQAAWLEQWWPLAGCEAGTRVEIGVERDRAWLRAVSCLERGLAVAIDYSHTRDARPAHGTLTGYRDGQQVEPVPDGSCDVTAHVALDACAGALGGLGLGDRNSGSTSTAFCELTTQRDVLHSLGISGARPPLDLARTDPSGYVRALSTASASTELTDPAGLGGFGWLLWGKNIRDLLR